MLGKLKSINVSTNFWIIIGTLTVLVLFYIFYLEYHIASQESRIVSTRFRVLDQFGDNIQDKIKSYQGNVGQLGSKIQYDAEKEAKALIYDFNLQNNGNESYKFEAEDIIDFIYYDLIYYGGIEKFTSYINKDLELVGFKLDIGGSDTVIMLENQRINPLLKPETDKYFYFDPVSINSKYFFSNTDSAYVRTEYNNLIKGLERKDVFDGFFILRDSEIVYSTLGSDLMLSTVKSDLEHINKNQGKEQIDDLLQHDDLLIPSKDEAIVGHVYSGEFLDITISNKDYKLFFKPVKIDGQDWFLCGLMDSSNFNAAKRSIPPWIIIVLSLVLVLILLGLPLIKLKVISKIEHLDTSTITNSALSILLGSSAVILFFLFLTQSTANLQNTDERLRSFSNEIYNSLTGEIEDAYGQLQEYDLVHEAFGLCDTLKYPDGPVITDILNHAADSIGYPSKYKFADYLFWINSRGKQSSYLTPFNEIGTLTDLKSRDYFKKKDEWFLPSDNSKKFRMESIVSLTSGSRKVALSTKSRVEDNPVIAVSARFYSLIDPIVPRNYGFCVIDESGKVWFHSNKNRNLMENFISECNDNSFIKSAIYSRTSKPVYVNYYNKPHRAFIQPIDKLPLYLVTFYDRSADTSFHAQVFTLTLILLGIFFFFLFVQIIILMAMERQLQWKLSKNLIMKITRPMIHLKNHYKFLVWIYLIAAFLTTILLSQMGKLQSIVIIYSMEIIIFTFSFRILNHNQVKVKRRQWFTLINLGILLLMDAAFYKMLSDSQGLIVFGYQLFFILFLEISYRLRKSKIENYTISLNASFIRVYVMFLIAIAIIFAVIPTLKFYEIGYNIESEIRLRHNQVDLMKKRETRNQAWNKYYNSQVRQTDTTRAILKERKDKGIYTGFLNRLHYSSDPVSDCTDKEYIRKQHSIFDSLVVFLRPLYDDEVVENKYLIFSGQKNSNKTWYSLGQDTLILQYLSQTEDSKSEQLAYHGIIAHMEILNFLAPFHGSAFSNSKRVISNILFWAVIIFILYILYFLVRFGIRNIYSLDVVQNYSHESLAETIRHEMLANKDIFIVRLSIKDETTAIENGLLKDIYLDWSDEKTIKNSIALINKSLEDKKASLTKSQSSSSESQVELHTSGLLNNSITVFIDHFEWRFDDPLIFEQKLEVLWTFINQKDIRLIILSQIHPEKILEYYRGIQENSSASADEATSKDLNYAQSLINYTEFKQLMTNIIINYIPTRFNYSWEDEDKFCLRSKAKMSFPGLIQSELEASDYLVQFKNALNKYYETYCVGREIENPEELIITKINSLAESYYEDLFNACTDEEKYVLYDLAEDLIMNQKNSNAIYGLLQKGILIKKCDKINFLNISFRRFVMNKSSIEDTSALEMKIGKEAGTWQGYKFTLIIIIVGLFVFIAMANQNFLDNLNQLFIAIGGGIAVITGILGLLSRKNTESS